MTKNDPASITSSENDIDRCRHYLFSQLKELKHSEPRSRPAITISYQTGAGEHEVAQRLAEILKQTEPDDSIPWTVFDRNLINIVLKEHHLPEILSKFLPEERRSFLKNVTEEFWGVRPPSWVIVPEIAETVLHLAQAGHAIIVGRGATFIASRIPNIFQVRLVAPIEKRIERVQHLNQLDSKAAIKYVASSDRNREGYLKAHFHAKSERSIYYHLVINTGRIPCPDAAQIIADAARKSFQHLPQSKTEQ